MYISVAPFLKTLGNYTSHSNLSGHHDACDVTPNSPSISKEIVPRTSGTLYYEDSDSSDS